MPFPSLFDSFRGPVLPIRDEASAFFERRAFRLHAILEAGRFSIHDVVNDARVRALVKEQWRLGRILDEDEAVETYIAYLEYREAASRGELPRDPRPRRSLFSL